MVTVGPAVTRGSTVRERLVRWALVVVVALHLALLYQPGSPEPGPELWPHADKLAHLLLFAAPALLLRLTTLAWWPVVLLAAHAPVSELVQHYALPRRSGDPLDLVADLLGVALGLVVAAWLHRRRGRRYSRQL